VQFHPEDPRLTAYVLGEIAPEEAAAIERAAAADPALQAVIDSTRGLENFLTDRLSLPGERLRPAQRENIRRTAREAARSGSILSFDALRTRFQPWLIPSAAAAVLALATFTLFRMPGDRTGTTVKNASPAAPTQPDTAFLPAPGPTQPASSIPPPKPVRTEDGLPSLVRRAPIASADFPTLELPVTAGNSSMDWISKSIRIDGKRPSPNAVRLEEMLNSFRFRLNGTAAIARDSAGNWHPDTRDSGVTAQVATLSTEMIACPWKPSSVLLLVSIRGNAKRDCDVRISYQAEIANVSRYRLLGYAPVEGTSAGSLPGTLPANSTTVLALEIEPLKPGLPLGSLIWSTDGKPAPTISLAHKSETEPSDDARFAALVCTYAQWLTGEQPGTIDADIVSALARETATSSLAADRSDFLNLIDRSLNL
jgi:hypothetical protein